MFNNMKVLLKICECGIKLKYLNQIQELSHHTACFLQNHKKNAWKSILQTFSPTIMLIFSLHYQ